MHYPTDPRIRTLEAGKARELEIEILARRETWEMVLEEDITKRAKSSQDPPSLQSKMSRGDNLFSSLVS